MNNVYMKCIRLATEPQSGQTIVNTVPLHRDDWSPGGIGRYTITREVQRFVGRFTPNTAPSIRPDRWTLKKTMKNEARAEKE
jgi:hypothetical protein